MSTDGWLFHNNGKLFQPDMKNDSLLGEGAYGYVFRSNVRTKTGVGEVCVVKRMDLGNKKNKNYLSKEQCDAEVRIMISCLNEPHLVQYIGSAFNEGIKTFAIAMELAICPLDVFVSTNVRSIYGLPYEIFIDVIRDCTSALFSLRKKNIAHRDIKAGNLLVFNGPYKNRRSRFFFKMSDFGFSKQKNTNESMMVTIAGTPNHLHPAIATNFHEQKEIKFYTSEQCDIWSLACTFFFCANNRDAFEVKTTEEYCQWVNDMLDKKEHSRAVGVHISEQGFKYTEQIGNEDYPKWFQHCATEMLISMFHNQKYTQLEEASQALAEVNESTFYILDPPARVQTLKYADLKTIQIFKNNYPTLHEVLGINELADDYYVISHLHIKKFTKDFEPQHGKSYILIRYSHTSGGQIQRSFWSHEVPVASIDNNVSYQVRCTKLKAAHKALIDGDNLDKFFTGMVQILEGILETLERSHDYNTPKDNSTRITNNKEILNQLAACLEVLTEFTPFLWQEYNQSLPTLNEIKANLKKYRLEDYEIIGVEDELSSLIVDPNQQINTYNRTEDYCRKLLKRCQDRKNEIAKQLQEILNKEDGLFWMALKLTDLYEMQKIAPLI